MLREAFVAAVREQLAHLGRSAAGEDTIWALRDVSFEVERGEVVGIIGRNGAGKSTLLKILSRITEPTEGRVEIHGRVGSLLEVGTGFHPELTGRENVYLSGAILGMRRAEIDRKFDEIIDFSGVERFLDTPFKRYSSGMRVRLGFAVAAHLEPENLLVDEVLAVGDAAFQKKCLGKMGDVAREGRTVLFVSHNLIAVQGLCGRAIWLDEGRVLEEGQPDEVVSNYLQTVRSTTTEQLWSDVSTAPGNERVRLQSARVRPVNGPASDAIAMDTPFVIEVEFCSLVPDPSMAVALQLRTEEGIVVFFTGTGPASTWQDDPVHAGLVHCACHIPGRLMNCGSYRVALIVASQGSVTYQHEDVLSFDVRDSLEGRGSWYGRRVGVVRPLLKWTTKFVARVI
jgi:lipopolysaccharide transport system ATP-binding protein